MFEHKSFTGTGNTPTDALAAAFKEAIQFTPREEVEALSAYVVYCRANNEYDAVVRFDEDILLNVIIARDESEWVKSQYYDLGPEGAALMVERDYEAEWIVFSKEWEESNIKYNEPENNIRH